MRFEFATATRIVFGPGTVREAAPAIGVLGQRALIVTGRDVSRAGPLPRELSERGVGSVLFAVEGEPDLDTVGRALALARAERCDIVVAQGGGSALDAGKAVAALLTNPGTVTDYLEVVGRGQPLTRPSAPFIAIPTTAGTGSEVTRNAVLTVPSQRVKVSMRSQHMLPALAIVDPELTLPLPPDLTAWTGLDALSQVIEPFVSNQPSPLVDAICREGIRLAAGSLRRAWQNGGDLGARTDMALASLCGGLALANGRLGAVHGFAGPLGGMFAAPHGAVCGRLLPFVTEVNISVLNRRNAASPALARYDQLGPLLTGEKSAAAADAVAWLHDLAGELGVPPLGAHGITKSDLAAIAVKAAAASSMKGNPVPLAEEDLLEILERAL